MDAIAQNREFLKNHWERLEGFISDQMKGATCPPVQKDVPENANIVSLFDPQQFTVGTKPLIETLRNRRSIRRFSDTPLTFEEFSFLLWSTQGIHKVLGDGTATIRTVPSAGARHSFETYLVVNKVEDLEPGLYRFQPVDYSICMLKPGGPDLAHQTAEACCGQKFAADCALTFIWTTIPYRMEWRYGSESAKVIAIDVGHVCENLYLACDAMDAGTCAIGAYFQDLIDKVVDVDGKDEFVIYIAPVGKLK